MAYGNLYSIDPVGARAKNSRGAPRGVPIKRPPRKKLHPVVYKLRDRRIALGMTQGEMAVKAGFELEPVQAWEQGKRFPKFPDFIVWCETLGVDFMLTADGEPL